MTSQLILQRWRKELTDTDGNPLPSDNSPFSNEWNNYATIDTTADLEAAIRICAERRGGLIHRIVHIDVLTDDNGVFIANKEK